MSIKNAAFMAPAVGFGVIDGVMTYKQKREEGAGVASAAMQAGTSAAMWTFFPSVMTGLMFHDLAREVGKTGVLNKKQLVTQYRDKMMQGASWHYDDTQTNATMRQRGLASIQQTRMGMANALGGEARSLHNGALY